MSETDNFFSLYLEYTAKTESPTFYHRWCAMTSLAAWIGRDIYFPFGHFKIHANMYTMLVGTAGTKKSTAIKIGAKLLKDAGYKKFAAKKTRQEKFLTDMAEDSEVPEEDVLEQNLFGNVDMETRPPAEVFVAADEVNNFIGVGNMDFMSILGDLWDIDEPFKYRLKNSTSVVIPYPTITILGGNTFAGFNKLFPPDAIEQGFFSRMLFIYAESIGRQHTIPPPPCEIVGGRLIETLKAIKTKVHGRVQITDEAYKLLDIIYMSWGGMNDARFEPYENRRIIHLLKIAMVYMAARLDTTLEKSDIIFANTLLTHTEKLMPKALGEFGKGRHSDVTHKIMQLLTAEMNTAYPEPVSNQKIWQHVHTDLESLKQMMELLGNLSYAKKIQAINHGEWLPIVAVKEKESTEALDWSLLSTAELGED